MVTRIDTKIDVKGDVNCFPSSAKVTVLQDEQLRERNIDTICEGDLVKIYDIKSKKIRFSPVIMFAHFNKLSQTEYLAISLENGNQITLSRDHLLFVGEEEKMIMAKEIKVDDILFTDNEEKIRVAGIKQVFENGFYCPITYGGTIFVNNILASCYASVTDYAILNGAYQMTAHEIAHLGLLPMRMWYRAFAKKKLNDRAKGIERPISEIHPYIRWLVKIELPWMAK